MSDLLAVWTAVSCGGDALPPLCKRPAAFFIHDMTGPEWSTRPESLHVSGATQNVKKSVDSTIRGVDEQPRGIEERSIQIKAVRLLSLRGSIQLLNLLSTNWRATVKAGGCRACLLSALDPSSRRPAGAGGRASTCPNLICRTEIGLFQKGQIESSDDNGDPLITTR